MSNDKTIYARIDPEKFEILEYPVLGIAIKNRAHPFDWYTKVIFKKKPEAVRFHTVQEHLEVLGDQVIASYTVVPDTLNQILTSLYMAKANATEAGQPVVPVMFSDLDQTAIEHIVRLCSKYVEDKMDAFAALKNYSSMSSACNYTGSSNSNFLADTTKCNQIRDNTLITAYAYLNKIRNGELAVPRDTSEIDAILPPMEW